MPSLAPPPGRDSVPVEAGSFGIRLATALGAATVAASVASLPAALRVGSAFSSMPRAWCACAATMLLPMFASVLVLRKARGGVRALGGEHPSARALGVAIWLVSLFFSLAAFGALLRATTHNHALAGATFAFGAVALAVGLGVVCARIAAIVGASPDQMRRGLVVGLGGLLALAVLVAGLRWAHALDGAANPPTSAGALCVDLLAFGLTALFASRPSLGSRPTLAIAGPIVAIAVLVLGIATLRAERMAFDAISTRAPALETVASLLSGR
jgi:hypothetical protein